MKGSTATSTDRVASTYVEPWTAIVIAERTVMAHRRNLRTLPFVTSAITEAPGPFLDTCSALFAKAGEGTVITLHVPCLPTYGHDPRPFAEQFRDLQGRANAGGWRSTSAGITHGSGWVTFTHRDGKPPVHLGVLTAMDDSADRTPLFDPRWSPEHIAAQLAEFAAATGVAYRATPGVAGIAAIRKYHEEKPVRRGAEREVPMWMWEDAPEVHTPGEIVWKRPLTAAEKKLGYVIAFDINKQYLAAMGAASYSWDLPKPTGAREFDPSAAGLWHIVAPLGHQQLGRPPAGSPALPTILNSVHLGANRSCWVTTPVLAFLHEYGTAPEVLDSYTSPAVRREFPDGRDWPGAGRWLRAPSERLRDAIVQHGRPVGHTRGCVCRNCRMASTLKRVGNEAIGMMATRTGRIRRVDVHHTTKDTARVGELRKIYAGAAAGYHPFRVAHDCVYYAAASPEPDPALIAALGVVTSGQVGRFKLEPDKSMPMKAYLAEQREHERRRKARRAD